MQHLTPAALASWQNFWVIVGSSAGALTGLQFVVITLIIQARAIGGIRNIHAFGTPTVMHFCTALLIAAIMASPWQSLAILAGTLAACGVIGISYSIRVIWHARAASYEPDLEDRIWYIVLPFVAHSCFIVGAALIWADLPWSLAAVGIDALLFLLLGVHNAWDTVTYIAVKEARPETDSSAQHSTPAA
jgi:hypothetical protein